MVVIQPSINIQSTSSPDVVMSGFRYITMNNFGSAMTTSKYGTSVRCNTSTSLASANAVVDNVTVGWQKRSVDPSSRYMSNGDVSSRYYDRNVSMYPVAWPNNDSNATTPAFTVSVVGDPGIDYVYVPIHFCTSSNTTFSYHHTTESTYDGQPYLRWEIDNGRFTRHTSTVGGVYPLILYGSDFSSLGAWYRYGDQPYIYLGTEVVTA